MLLDIGCGTGFLSIPAAEIVGSSGRVYAVDVNQKYLEKLRRRIQEKNLDNVIIVEGDAADMPQVPDGTIDKAVMMLSLHHIRNWDAALKQVCKKLRGGGLLLIADPIRYRLLGHGSKPKQALTVLDDIGFETISYTTSRLTWNALLRRVASTGERPRACRHSHQR